MEQSSVSMQEEVDKNYKKGASNLKLHPYQHNAKCEMKLYYLCLVHLAKKNHTQPEQAHLLSTFYQDNL